MTESIGINKQIRINNLNCLVENISNARQWRQKLDGRIRQVYQIIYQVIKLQVEYCIHMDCCFNKLF